MGFQGRMIDGLGVKGILKYSIAFSKGPGHISKFLFDEKRGIIFDTIMNYRCTILLRLQGIEYGRQFFIVHRN